MSSPPATTCRRKFPPRTLRDPISVLKPLSGADEGLEANLRSFFEQDHPEYELLFAVRDAADPAVRVVRALIEKFPSRTARLLITGEPPYPNAKVYSLERMVAEARYDIARNERQRHPRRTRIPAFHRRRVQRSRASHWQLVPIARWRARASGLSSKPKA